MRQPLRRPLAAGRPLSPRAGVSLVVVMLALLLVGVAAVIAIPAYFNRHDVTLDNACRLLSRDLRTLQNRAAFDKREVRVVFDSDGWCAVDPNGELVAGVGESVPIVRRFAGEGVFVGVVVERFELGADRVLTIDPRGLVTEHGEVELSFRGEHRLLKIHREGGDVTVEALAR